MLYFTYLDVRSLFDGEKLREGLKNLPPDRASRVLAQKGYANRARRLGGEMLLHYLYEKSEEDFSDLTAPERGFPEIAETEFGKPYFAHRSDIEFNISHSGMVAVCALNRVSGWLTASQVGVDVELVGTKTPEQMKKIASRFFLREERKLLNRASDESEYIKEFTRIWVRKESIVKCLGTGMRDIIFADSTSPEKHSIKLTDHEIWVGEQAISASANKRLYLVTVAEKNNEYVEDEFDAAEKKRQALAAEEQRMRDAGLEEEDEEQSERHRNFFNFDL